MRVIIVVLLVVALLGALHARADHCSSERIDPQNRPSNVLPGLELNDNGHINFGDSALFYDGRGDAPNRVGFRVFVDGENNDIVGRVDELCRLSGEGRRLIEVRRVNSAEAPPDTELYLGPASVATADFFGAGSTYLDNSNPRACKDDVCCLHVPDFDGQDLNDPTTFFLPEECNDVPLALFFTYGATTARLPPTVNQAVYSGVPQFCSPLTLVPLCARPSFTSFWERCKLTNLFRADRDLGFTCKHDVTAVHQHEALYKVFNPNQRELVYQFESDSGITSTGFLGSCDSEIVADHVPGVKCSGKDCKHSVRLFALTEPAEVRRAAGNALAFLRRILDNTDLTERCSAFVNGEGGFLPRFFIDRETDDDLDDGFRNYAAGLLNGRNGLINQRCKCDFLVRDVFNAAGYERKLQDVGYPCKRKCGNAECNPVNICHEGVCHNGGCLNGAA